MFKKTKFFALRTIVYLLISTKNKIVGNYLVCIEKFPYRNCLFYYVIGISTYWGSEIAFLIGNRGGIKLGIYLFFH